MCMCENVCNRIDGHTDVCVCVRMFAFYVCMSMNVCILCVHVYVCVCVRMCAFYVCMSMYVYV